jgi:phosphohistidine phosphatase
MSVLLYLMRHGIAAEPTPGTNDAERALTPEGVRKTTRVAVGLQRLDVKPDVILTSPLRRAAETARLVADVLAPRAGVELYPPLAGGLPAADVVRGLRPHRRARALFLVGHQPDLGDLASYLLTGTASLAPLPFKKAGVAAITLGAVPPRAAGALEWFLTPSQLRAIAASRKE